MKKLLSLILAGVVTATILSGCGSSETSGGTQGGGSGKTSLTVVTTYGGDDGGREPYEAACKAWSDKTGNKINNDSGTANEAFKAKVISDFETGAEPDVLFYFNGVDSDKIVNSGKVVSIEDIRKEFPDYASAHDDALIPVSPADGKAYAIPSYGYWELMFVNKTVLSNCGLEVPDENTTWEQFLEMCEVIKKNGYTPIAMSAHEIPHYWFEYCIMNYSGVSAHNNAPISADDQTGMNWAAGLNDIKELYDLGYLPANTLTASDPETFQLLYDDMAAFAIDGSWKIGNVETASGHPDDFTVTFVPGKNNRKSTDIIAGLSSGWYITKKAWDNPEKRAAAVDFVQYMTSEEVIASFGAAGATVSLKSGAIIPDEATQIKMDSIAVLGKITGTTPAAQDNLSQTGRESLFSDVKNIITGNKTAEQAITDALSVN